MLRAWLTRSSGPVNKRVGGGCVAQGRPSAAGLPRSSSTLPAAVNMDGNGPFGSAGGEVGGSVGRMRIECWCNEPFN